MTQVKPDITEDFDAHSSRGPGGSKGGLDARPRRCGLLLCLGIFLAARVAVGAATLNFTIGSGEGANGAQVVVPIVAAGFQNLIGFQCSLHWNPAVAQFVGVEQLPLALTNNFTTGNFGTVEVGAGTLRVSWDDADGTGQTLPDGTVIYGVRFLLTGAAGASSSITIDGSPLPMEAANQNYNPLIIASVPGQLSVVSGNHPPVPASPVLARFPSGGAKSPVAAFLGTDPDGDALSLGAMDSVGAQGGGIGRSGNWVFYTPAASVTNGDTFGFAVSDGRGGNVNGVATVALKPPAVSVSIRTKDLGNGYSELDFAGIPGRSYSLEWRPSDSSSTWQALAVVTTDATGSGRTIDTSANVAQRAYRIAPVADF